MLVYLTGLVLLLLPRIITFLIGTLRFRPSATPALRRWQAPLSRSWRTGIALALVWFWCNGSGLLWPAYRMALQMDRWQAPAYQAGDALPGTAGPSADAIVLLGGGTEHSGANGALRPQGDSVEKIALAATLYHTFARTYPRSLATDETASIPAPRLIITGGDPQHHGMAEADNYRPDLLSLGVPSTAITLENRSLNTWQNAVFTARILHSEGPQRIWLITTAMHMRRALLYFQLVGIHVYPQAPPPHAARWSLLPRADNLALSNGALHELIGIAQFFVYTRLGIY